MNHHRQGTGTPVVLIHGIGHRWQGWQPVMDALADDPLELIACDSPGFGSSEPLPAGVPRTIASYVDAYAALFEELGLRRPHVAGNSMGGAIALELAKRGLVASATAFSPAGFWSPAEQRLAQTSLKLTQGLPRPLQAFARSAVGHPLGRVALLSQTFGYPARMPAEDARAMLDDAFSSPSFAETLRGFDGYVVAPGGALAQTPVTVAWGRKDYLLLYRPQSRRARALLPGARHVTIGAGHVPYYDDPAQCAAVVRSTVLAG